MIKTFIITKDLKFEEIYKLDDVKNDNVLWYWVDFHSPTIDEVSLLDEFFHFHELAIEDCMHDLQRPKMDHYEDHRFFVVHSIENKSLDVHEVDMFLGSNFLVTFHKNESMEINEAIIELSNDQDIRSEGPLGSVYLIIDNLVDRYFPIIYKIEDRLNDLDDNTKELSGNAIMEQVFALRNDLIYLRKTVVPMRDLLYRILNSNKIQRMKEHREYFHNIYDHLLKLSEMIDSNRELTADMRDSYISLNAQRMNSIMMTLTVITTIFMPLTFIAGIYGMNFQYMPELNWKYGYYFIISLMILLGTFMFVWFKKKGWFNK